MNRFIPALLLLSATVVVAQAPPPKLVPPPTGARVSANLERTHGRSALSSSLSPLQIVPQRARLTNRLIFVIDVSGSMREDEKFAQAIQSVLLILGYKSDEQEIAAITFCGKQARWEGSPECVAHGQGDDCNKRCVPAGWAMVWPGTAEKMVSWLSNHERSGVTDPAPALVAAISEPRDHLSVIFISDGEFSAPPVLEAVKKAQKARRKAGRSFAPIMVWGAGGGARKQKPLKKLVKLGKGGFWVHGKRRSGPW